MKTLITLILLTIFILPATSQVTWYTQDSGVNRELTDVCFANQGAGWISGWTGTILHSGDRGMDWNQQDPPPTNAYYTVAFTDSDNGWAAGYAGLMVHTTDGGQNWTMQSLPTNYDIYSIYFLNDQEGWAAGGEYGGFPSDIDDRIILHTMDGGQNWTTQYAEAYKAPLKSIQFTDEMYGFATGDNGIIMKTMDGGSNWTEITVDQLFDFADLFFVSSSEGWLCGEYLGLPHHASVFKTTDGGLSWNEYQLGEDESMGGIYFTDQYTGWTVGGHFYDNVARIYHTTDGGETWVQESAPDGTPSLASVYFIDENTGWAVGHLGTIISTVSETTVGINDLSDGSTGKTESGIIESVYPNPFRDRVHIDFQAPGDSRTTIEIYDITGQRVKTLMDGNAVTGKNEVTWDGTGDSGNKLSEGIYFCRLQAGNITETRRLDLLR